MKGGGSSRPKKRGLGTGAKRDEKEQLIEAEDE